MRRSFVTNLALSVFVFVAQLGRTCFGSDSYCEDLFGLGSINHGSREECESYNSYPNVMLLGGVHCFNNGTGICKAFAGQFEFYFNTFNDTIIGPAPESKYVGTGGLHSRIPVSYNVDGKIIYADRSINWARKFKETLNGNHISLLSMSDFNWCQYTKNDLWPYKTAVKDSKSNGRFHVYFYNRQSCVYDTVKKKRQHFNTRFMNNDSLRIELENNPLIFAMEDYLAKEVRLVKNKRQHWYEVPFETVELDGHKSIRYFVEMAPDQREPCMINGTTAPLLSNDAFRKYGSDVCLTDQVHKRAKGEKNSGPLWHHCGADEVETADYPMAHYFHERGQVVEVDLHNLPKHPHLSESFYGVNYESYSNWTTFAAHGFSFTATTSIPIANQTDRVRVISLFSDFHQTKDNKYDENYPMPMMADFTAYYYRPSGQDEGVWNIKDRSKKAIQVRNLNYVDDIAYLHACDTVLVIFGPLYSELAADKFRVNARGPIGSIDELGSYELINAAFAEPFERILYLYHRLNYVSKHRYTCASGHGRGQARQGLVTAVMLGSYTPRWGPGQLDVFKKEPDKRMSIALREETFFRVSGVLSELPPRPEAPKPSLYADAALPRPEPLLEGDTRWVYMVVVVGALICVSMCMVCTITMRRRRRRRQRKLFEEMQKSRSSSLSSHASKGLPSLGSATLDEVAPPETGSRDAEMSLRSSSQADKFETLQLPSKAADGAAETSERSRGSKRGSDYFSFKA